MKYDVRACLEKHSDDLKVLFCELRKLVLNSSPQSVEEKLWAKLPSYYVGNRFIRLIPFKDHINVEASALAEYKDRLSAYRFTPKNMLQIYLDQPIPYSELSDVIQKTLGGMIK